MGMPGNKRDTICHQGCAMTCLAMALAGNNISIPQGDSGQRVVANPGIVSKFWFSYFLESPSHNYFAGTLNEWLVANNGYKCIAGW